MDIRNRRALKEEAAASLASAHNPKQIISVYIGASIVLSIAMVAANAWLGKQIDGITGLSNFGNRAIYQTAQTALPYLEFFLIMCWDIGFLRAVLRLARRQHTEARELTAGFSLFGPILRLSLAQVLICMGVMMGCMILGIQIFCLLPISNAAAEIVLPYIESATVLNTGVVMDDAAYAALAEALIPCIILILVLFALVTVPLTYRMRLARYCLLDHPRAGAFAALRQSWQFTKGNCLSLLKLDVSFWGYYMLMLLSAALCYGDVLLPLAGVALPFDAKTGYYVFYAAYFVVHFALNYFLRLKVETTYALAYEALRPRPSDDGVVLGNIFRM